MADTRIPSAEEILRNYISKINESEDLLEELDEAGLAEYKKQVEEGLTKDWIEAYYAVAYGCYGGNRAFECDWVKSRDALLKIIELQGDVDPFIYNTLGYIYYYGRCNNKVPEYDLAFKYYSVGASGGVFESKYKLADMYISGKGVPKSERAAVTILSDLYDETKEIFCDGGFEGKFADVALRVGGLFEKGIGVERDPEIAYAHYKEAEYALKLRRENCEYIGDDKVEESIKLGISATMFELPEGFIKDEYVSNDPELIGYLLSEMTALELELKEEYGEYFLIASGIASEQIPDKVLINVPELDYCELVDSIKLKVNGIRDIDERKLPERGFINSISFDVDSKKWVFSLRDFVLFKFGCDSFSFKCK